MNKKAKRILFIHHSVGRDIINVGLKENLKQQNIFMTDIDYNRIGTHDENNNKIEGLIIPEDNTNPEGLIKMFNNEKTIKYFNLFDLIIIKSCYTAFLCKSDAQFKKRLKAIKEFNKISSKIILMTPPPLSKFRYLITNKVRYKKIINEYSNIISSGKINVFNLHAILSTNNKWLNSEYQRKLFFNSHPNNLGSLKASIALFNEIIKILK